MSRLPRLALGTVHPEADAGPLLWALMANLKSQSIRIQHFVSRACFCPNDGAASVTGLAARHLDTWIMSPAVCRELFQRTATTRDLAIVSGRFDDHRVGRPEPGGSLDLLCDYLSLPRLAILDARWLGHCILPNRPDLLDGVVLDWVGDRGEFFRLQTTLESLWGVPVVAGLAAPRGLRARASSLPRGSVPDEALCRELGEHLVWGSQWQAVMQRAATSELPDVAPAVFRMPEVRARGVVAVAYDAAFQCYFPDVLELLELNGVSVSVFSPLKDEHLPPGTDIVYFGCGHPERHLAELAGNLCLLTELRRYACRGGRVYAEGGGLAYLCQHVLGEDGSRVPLAGLIPALASRAPNPAPPEPVELTLSSDVWLGPAGSVVRGYVNRGWILLPSPELESLATEPGRQLDLLRRNQVVASRVHLHFAAQPQFLGGFMETERQVARFSGERNRAP